MLPVPSRSVDCDFKSICLLFNAETYINPNKAPWESSNFMEIVPADLAIDNQTTHDDDYGRTDDFDIALPVFPDNDQVEFSILTRVSLTIKAHSININPQH